MNDSKNNAQTSAGAAGDPLKRCHPSGMHVHFPKRCRDSIPERFGVRETTWHHDSQEMEDVHIEHRPPLTIQACCGKDPDRWGSDSIGANGKGCEYHCRLFERTRDVLHKQKTSDACRQAARGT